MDVDLAMLVSAASGKKVTAGTGATLNVVSEDAAGCCNAIRKALRAKPDMERWVCARCGMDWVANLVEGVKMWEARPVVHVWVRPSSQR